MRIGILGTGVVGSTLGTALARRGNEVKMGSRTSGNPAAEEWAQTSGRGASHGSFADAAQFGEIVFNCTAGVASLDALEMAGADNLRGKILIDVANPLDFSRGMPPSLTVCNTDSLGEQIQRAYPDAKVVKALNTMNTAVMVDPTLVPAPHDVFIAGNDADAKRRVAALLGEWFGWTPGSIIDVGDISAARGTEMMLPVWLRLWQALGTNQINFHIARAGV